RGGSNRHAHGHGHRHLNNAGFAHPARDRLFHLLGFVLVRRHVHRHLAGAGDILAHLFNVLFLDHAVDGDIDIPGHRHTADGRDGDFFFLVLITAVVTGHFLDLGLGLVGALGDVELANPRPRPALPGRVLARLAHRTAPVASTRSAAATAIPATVH